MNKSGLAGLADRGRCCASCGASPSPSSGTPRSPSPWRCPACPGHSPPSHCRTTEQDFNKRGANTPTHGRETHGQHQRGPGNVHKHSSSFVLLRFKTSCYTSYPFRKTIINFFYLHLGLDYDASLKPFKWVQVIFVRYIVSSLC